MKNMTIVKRICDDCIKEGEALTNTQWDNKYLGDLVIANPTTYVDPASVDL